MKTKILVVLAAIALVFALVFTACDTGGGGGGGGDPGGQTPGNQTTGGDDYDGTPGLAFELITSGAGRSARAADDGNAYRVRKGRVRSGEVKIPATYKGKPVREIGSANDDENNGAFADTDITDITIPDTVEFIGSNAFRGSRRLNRLVIPEGVTVIGESAFQNCNFTSATIPGSVKEIGGVAFAQCKNLTSVTISEGVTHIGGAAFWLCTSLTNVTIPSSVTHIGTFVFEDCTSLTSITIPASVEFIGFGAFSRCPNLTSITVAAGNPNYSNEDGILYSNIKTYNWEDPRYWDNMQIVYTDNKQKTVLHSYPGASGNVTIASSVTTIGLWAFYGATNLTGITIPEGVSIGREAFWWCTNLTSVSIPASATEGIESIFLGCISLSNITVAPGNPNYSSEGGALYDKNKTVLFSYQSASGNVTIASSVKEIWDAFSGCTNLTGITIPESVTSIGGFAFAGCTNITSIEIPESVTSIRNAAFAGWTSSQTIYVKGYASQAEADAAWGNNLTGCWRGENTLGYYIDAVIKYWNGSDWI
jgi:hypothetical protein